MMGKRWSCSRLRNFPATFSPEADWCEAVRNDQEGILASLEAQCRSCGQPPRYAWVNALEAAPVTKLPSLGIRQSLLTVANAHPVALCARCTVRRIEHSLTAQEGGYLEICGPYGGMTGWSPGWDIRLASGFRYFPDSLSLFSTSDRARTLSFKERNMTLMHQNPCSEGSFFGRAKPPLQSCAVL